MMSMLIEALSDDKDAMVYNSEMNSDPYMGKRRSGGSLASMNLPNPNLILDQLYGNPFGMSGANMFGSYPSMPNFYPQAMLGLPTPVSPYAASPYYPQLPYPSYPVPGMPQTYQPPVQNPPLQPYTYQQPYQAPQLPMQPAPYQQPGQMAPAPYPQPPVQWPQPGVRQ